MSKFRKILDNWSAKYNINGVVEVLIQNEVIDDAIEGKYIGDYLNKCDTDVTRYRFVNCCFNAAVTLYLLPRENVIFENCTFIDHAKMIGGWLTFNGCIFKRKVWFEKARISAKDCTFAHDALAGSVEVSDCGNSDLVSFMNCDIYRITFYNHCSTINLHDCRINHIDFERGCYFSVTIDEIKDLAKQFIKNPDNDSRLPIIEDYNIDGYGTVMTTVRHVFSLQYDRSSSAGVCSDVRYELQKAYNELRDEVCVSKFGKVYDQCSDSEQQFARAMYAMKISEALPKSYDGEGNLIIKEVKSAAGNYVIKDEKVNKDLRIRVTNNPPVRLYVSTVMFDNENGQDQFKSETAPIQISLESLDDYIDQAISDGMKIRKVRLAIRPDVPMGPISDLKETLRNRMLLSIVQESYKEPAVAVIAEQVEEDGIFNGKLPETVQYIQDNISFPDEAKQDSNGNVLAIFTIGKDGNVMNPEIKGSSDHSLDAQALQVLSQMPAWVPARNENGEAIEVKYTIPVSVPSEK